MVAALRDEGTAAEDGRFTVDAQSAARKLRELELHNPLHWVLLALRGAIRGGARAMEVHEDGATLVMHWRGVPELPPAELLPSAGLAADGGGAPGVRELVLAAYTGLNAGLDRVTLRVGTREITVSADGVTERSMQPCDGAWLLAEGALGPRIDGHRAEIWVLRKRGRYLEIPLEVAFERASVGWAGSVEPMQEAVEGTPRFDPPLRIQAAQLPAEEGEVRLLVDGVWVESVTASWLPVGFVAVAANELQLDVGQQRVREDEARAEVLEAARQLAEWVELPRSTSLWREEIHNELQLGWQRSERAHRLRRLAWVGGAAVAEGVAWLDVRALAVENSARIGAGHLGVGPAVMGLVLVVFLGLYLRQESSRLRGQRELAFRYPPHHPARELVPEPLRSGAPPHPLGVVVPGVLVGLLVGMLLGRSAAGEVSELAGYFVLTVAPPLAIIGGVLATFVSDRWRGRTPAPVESPL